MSRKKGFTLIELLSVIVILAIIVVIGVPKLRDVINNSKEKARKQDGELLLRALNNEIYAKKVLDNNYNPEFCKVIDNVVTCNGEEININKSNNKINGEIYLVDGEVKLYNLLIGNTEYTNIEYTDERCFDFGKVGSVIGVYGYYDYVDNDSNNEPCPRDVVIPKYYEGMQINTIGGWAFRLKNLTSVILPYGIEAIYSSAFDSNNLTSIIIPDSVTTIEEGAFMDNQLTSVTIPNGVTVIDNSVFFGNELTTVVLPNNLKRIDENAFYRNQITNIDIPEGVTVIEQDAFSFNQLTSIVIPDSVTTIGKDAFKYNKLTSVVIGQNHSSIESIGKGAFANNQYAGYGPNNISEIVLYLRQNSDFYTNLYNSGLYSYDAEIQWIEQ